MAAADDSVSPKQVDSAKVDLPDEEIDCNVIVVSEAGKPIYSRFGSEEENTRICGLIQAIRLSLADSRLGLGEIQSLQSGSFKMVFMTVQSITLLAVAKMGRHGEVETEAYLRLQLEYVYGQILLTLTEQVQTIFLQNPNFDLRETLGATESLIGGMLNEASPKNGGSASFLSGGIESVFPIAAEIRDHASRVLLDTGEKADNTVFALLVTGTKLLTMVQPKHAPHQLSSFDLHLLINFVNERPGLLTSELWFPVCLPRFNASGFLYVYTNCLDVDTNLTLVLVSQASSTEQFQLFRRAATAIREKLGLPAAVSDVIQVLDSTDTPAEPTSRDDIAWRRSLAFDNGDGDEDYVDASLDGGGMIPYVFKDSEPPVSPNKRSNCSLLIGLERAINPEQMETMLENFCSIAQATHFVFRLDAPVQTDRPQAGKLTQYLSSPLDFPFVDDSSKRRVMSMYQKLQLRLRLGSATCESTLDAFDMMSDAQAASEERMKGISRYCPASCVVENAPSVQGVTYVIDDLELFLAMNGRDFELYMVVPSTLTVKQAATHGARLVRKLLLERKTLFLAAPLSWRE